VVVEGECPLDAEPFWNYLIACRPKLPVVEIHGPDYNCIVFLLNPYLGVPP